MQYGGVAASLGMAAPGMAAADTARLCQPWAQFENWGDSGIVVTSPLTETTSTDVDDSGDKHDAQMVRACSVLVPHGYLRIAAECFLRAVFVVLQGGGIAQRAGAKLDPSVVSKERPGDHKVQRRLAQNREAARKSRIRKKAYIEELESSRAKLAQLEQELQRARQQLTSAYGRALFQGMFIASGCSGDHGYSTGGALAFDVEYARWLDEHQRHMTDLRMALAAQMADGDLRVLVDGAMSHYDQVFRLKSLASRGDVFHVMSGMWLSPAERFFMWLGGFRPSEVLRAVAGQLDQGPCTEQQLVGICNLQQTSQQAEEALSQGMDVLQQTLADTLASAASGVTGGGGGGVGPADSVTNYVGQMAMAMAKLGTLENFMRQADLLRQQTLEQMRRILSTRQSARALLVISDYFSRLRALSSLWLARPRDFAASWT
ncbi:hypothetical protein PR202_gb17259 [Eleusine coracana subsp. coracana]|uniref:Uncharacterized protein n=1 Tax=Eleusine coracana subsp. coracana TaxID=191504 RepID=A0AAV5F2I8_ELECO|nr:hypothetical protein PR202_gb17259 [Eleusine coracana subsp. coracana]